MGDTQEAENPGGGTSDQSLEIETYTPTANDDISQTTSKRGITDILNKKCQSSQRIRDLLTDTTVQYNLMPKLSIPQKRKTLYT